MYAKLHFQTREEITILNQRKILTKLYCDEIVEEPRYLSLKRIFRENPSMTP